MGRTFDDYVDLLHLSKSFEVQSALTLDECAARLEALSNRQTINWSRRITEAEVMRTEESRYDFEIRILHRRSERPGYSVTAAAEGSLRKTDTGGTMARGEAKLDTMQVVGMGIGLIIAPIFLLVFKFPGWVFLVLIAAFVAIAYRMYASREEVVRMVEQALV